MDSSLSDFRFRQIHLDFHTSEHIPDVGADFDPEEFARTLGDANVDSVTLAARCHHGWAYYPSNLAKPHPNLARPDLLGDMVSACRGRGIATPIYLAVQWDERTAREHPEWRVMSHDNRAPSDPGAEPSAGNQLTATWHPLCLNHPELVDWHIETGLEVVARYDPPGLFMDICKSWQCACNACLESMRAAGRDPTRAADRVANDRDVLANFHERFSGAVGARFPAVRIFYNSGHILKGQPDRYRHFGHLELESLPTGGWGYDHFPASARYVAGLGKPYLGMTGRFHTHWGEFGGYKSADALAFECCQMLMLGARCSVGDQLHPRGRLDKAAYDLVKPAYDRVARLEPFARGAYRSEVALVSVEAHEDRRAVRLRPRAALADTAAARLLSELHVPFDVIEEDWSLAGYRLVILPDSISVDDGFAERLNAHAASGGAVLATGSSGLAPDGASFAIDVGAELDGTLPFDPCYMTTDKLGGELPGAPIVMYEAPLRLKATDAEVLSDIRQPYFNRSWDRFCSHLHAPEDPAAPSAGPAALRKGNVAYSPFSLFRLYGETGQVNYKRVVKDLVGRLMPDSLVGADLPSAGRVSVISQPEHGRDVLHLLYAPTQLRGAGMRYGDGEVRPVEVVEDAPTLRDVRAWIRAASPPASVRCAYSGEELPWRHAEGRTRVAFPEMRIHAAAVMEWGPGHEA